MDSSWIIQMSQKRTVADAQQHANAHAVVVCHGEIGLQITVEVCHSNALWFDSCLEIDMRPISAIAIVEQNTYSVGQDIAGNQVCFPVSVEVARCHELRLVPGGILGGNEELLLTPNLGHA